MFSTICSVFIHHGGPGGYAQFYDIATNINLDGQNFGKLLQICQIRQSFTLPPFCTIQYIMNSYCSVLS